jgi:flagellar basal-body rod modification protein FlgD
MATAPIGSTAGAATQGGTNNDALRGLDMDQFLELMIAELQNQDPLNPMDNAQILQQISQIREIGATSKLSDTLDAVLLGQNLSSASGMIGRTIKALTDDGHQAQGEVERVTLADGQVRLHVGGQAVRLTNVSEILP